jgi:hypothetical protein
MKRACLVIWLLLLAAQASGESLSDLKTPSPQVSRKTGWGRDPFIKFGQTDDKKIKEAQPASLKISGIISDGSRAVAIINDKFFRVGDRVDGYLITGISNEKILLEYQDKKYYFGIEKFALEGGKK